MMDKMQNVLAVSAMFLIAGFCLVAAAISVRVLLQIAGVI
jgi:hypothetical protein